MPRWLTGLLVLLLLLVFVFPNPVRAGNWTGNAMDSMMLFARSFANQVAPTVADPVDPADPADPPADPPARRRHPVGGVASGDGTYLAAAPAVVSTAVTAAVTTGTATADPVPDLGGEATLTPSRPVRLRIPASGVSSNLLVGLGLEPDGTLSVPLSAEVVGWYRDGPTPGERGPAVVTGHVDWMHREGVFHDLGRMRPGDEATIDRADGTAVVFRVTRVAQYPKAWFPADEVYADTDDAQLRLITCGGTLDAAAHSYSDNVVVYARMVRVIR